MNTTTRRVVAVGVSLASLATCWLWPAIPVRAQAGAHTVPSGRMMTVHIYYVALKDTNTIGQKIGCGDGLIAVMKKIPQTSTPLAAAIRELVGNHRAFYGQSGLYNSLYRSRLTVQQATISHGLATIRLVGTMKLGGVCDSPRVTAQLQHTALQFRSVHTTAIFINGVPLKKLLSGKG